MSRVYVVQEPLKVENGVVSPRISYRPLRAYGEIRFLFQWSDLKDDDPLDDVSSIIWRLRDALDDFRDADYMVCLGNPALIGMAIAIAADCNDGRVQILDWIKKERRYRVVNMDLDCARPALARTAASR